MREFEKNISVNVIATFEWDKYNEQQEIFDIKYIWKIALKDKKHLINYMAICLPSFIYDLFLYSFSSVVLTPLTQTLNGV